MLKSMLKDIMFMNATERLAATRVVRGLILYFGGLLALALMGALSGYVLADWLYGMGLAGSGGVAAFLMSGLAAGLVVFGVSVLKKDRVRRGFRVFLIALAVILYGGVVAGAFVLAPMGSYQIAIDQMELAATLQATDPERAETLYGYAENGLAGLGSYRDSAERLAEIRKQRAYVRAAREEQEGFYFSAAEAFAALGDYRDSAQRAKASMDSYNRQKFDAAAALLEKGEYMKAYQQMHKLRGYGPADALLTSDARLQEGREMALQPGQMVEFGEYTKSIVSDEKIEVEWIILERDGDRALLLSRYALIRRPWHDGGEPVSWEESALRAWMNGEFEKSLLSDAERACVLPTDTTAGAADRLFLLSSEEWSRYRYMPAMRGDCKATPLARGEEYGYDVIYTWLLRDPALEMASVAYPIDDQQEEFYIRPAFWVTLVPEIF